MKNLKEGIVINLDQQEGALHFDSILGKVSLFSKAAPIEDRVNEDACGARELGGILVLVIADGLGGHKNGTLASEIVLKNLIFDWSPTEQFTLEKLISKIEKSHSEIKDLRTGAGSTVVIAIVEASSIRFLSVGDSSGFLFSGHKNFKFKTLEQSPAGLGVEAGLLDENEALDHEESHVVLNAIGHDPLRFELTGKLEFSDRDFALLATDGLTANILQEEFSEYLANKEDFSPLDLIAEKAVEKMTGGGHPDDLSMVLFMK